MEAIRITETRLQAVGSRLLQGYGVPDLAARQVMTVLIRGDARGFASHGLIRLKNVVTGLQAGTHQPLARPEFRPRGPCGWFVDGQMGLGPPVAWETMERVVRTAQEHGLGLAVARNLTHFGIAGFYAEMAASNGLLGLVLCNTEPAQSPFGGRNKVLGTNPICFSAPGPDAASPPITLDMATTAAARGKILAHQLAGTPLPPHIATGPDGQMTTDPAAALAGSLLPLGGEFGYKGTGLAIMVDLLTGGLAGAATGTRVTGTVTTTDPCTAGFFFMAINPEFFGRTAAFRQATAALLGDLAAAGDGVLPPGALEHQREAQARDQGILLSGPLRALLNHLLEEGHVDDRF